MVKKCHYWFGI